MTYLFWKAHATMVFRNYYRNKEQMEQFRRDVILGKKGSDEGMPHGTDLSDPTARAALIIAGNPYMSELDREIKAVEAILHNASGDKLSFLRQVLISNRTTMEGCEAYYGICSRTAKRWKKDFCEQLAKSLGWIA